LGDDIVAAVGEGVLGEEIVIVVLGFAAASSFGGVWVGIVESAPDRSIICPKCRLRENFGVAVGIAAAAAADEELLLLLLLETKVGTLRESVRVLE